MITLHRIPFRLDRYIGLIIGPVWIALIANWSGQEPNWWSRCTPEHCVHGLTLLCSLWGSMLMVAYERSIRGTVNSYIVASAIGSIGAWIAWTLSNYASTGIALGLMYWGAALGVRWWHYPKNERKNYLASVEGLRAIFFLSGVSALLYQVVWQRRLMAFFGASSESISLIVAVFMGGLGLGGILSEIVVRRWSKYAIQAFFYVELGIAICGVISIPMLDPSIGWLIEIPSGWKLVGTLAALLLLPTMLMGATLPLLVGALRNRVPDMHENVGKLYAINALGSAIAALLTVLLLFVFMGQKSVTWMAAAFNILTAVLVYHVGKAQTNVKEAVIEMHRVPSITLCLPGWFVLALLAGLAGFLSLGQEILLIKQLMWTTGSQPDIFGKAVGCFLLGLAYGSWQQCALTQAVLLEHAYRYWLRLAMLLASVPFLLPALLHMTYFSKDIVTLGLFGLLAACGYLGGRTLPIITGLMRSSEHTYFGRVLAANIAGCVLGSYILGNYASDYLSLKILIISVAIGSMGLAIVFACLERYVNSLRTFWKTAYLEWVGIILALCLWPWLSSLWLELMLSNSMQKQLVPFEWVKETRSGIIAVLPTDPKTVIGGGVYDGKLSFKAWPDENMLGRLYRLLALHDYPENVLEIGLSGGAWARAITLDKRVKHLTSIEINSGYLDLIQQYPIVRPILTDPKVNIVVDDARRWLRIHPERYFDLIVSNTSFHWRQGATLITSVEFVQLLKAHLKPGGIVLINTTSSENVAATVAYVFKNNMIIGNTVIGSDQPFDLSQKHARLRLVEHPEFQHVTEQQWKQWFLNWQPHLLKLPKNARVITDDSMTDEYKRKFEALP
ncbi:MAG: methyltransferase domain-containing protein [Pseudomonadota bacterium]